MASRRCGRWRKSSASRCRSSSRWRTSRTSNARSSATCRCASGRTGSAIKACCSRSRTSSSCSPRKSSSLRGRTNSCSSSLPCCRSCPRLRPGPSCRSHRTWCLPKPTPDCCTSWRSLRWASMASSSPAGHRIRNMLSSAACARQRKSSLMRLPWALLWFACS